MKKHLRTIIRISTITLIALSLIGILVLILDESSPYSTTYEIIAFTIGMAGMFLTVFSQIDSVKQDHTIARITKSLNELITESEEQITSDTATSRKLNKLIALNQEIYEAVKHKKR